RLAGAGGPAPPALHSPPGGRCARPATPPPGSRSRAPPARAGVSSLPRGPAPPPARTPRPRAPRPPPAGAPPAPARPRPRPGGAVAADPAPQERGRRIMTGADQLPGLETEQIVGHLARRGITGVAVAGHGLLDDRQQIARRVRDVLGERGRRRAQDLLDQIGG